MLKPILSLLAFGCLCSASTIELARIFSPLTLVDTGTASNLQQDGEPLPVAIMERPIAISGRVPEALIEAVAIPFAIDTNQPQLYQVSEANLIALCGVEIEAFIDEADDLNIKLIMPSKEAVQDIDITLKQLVELILMSIEKTLSANNQGEKWESKINLTFEGDGAGDLINSNKTIELLSETEKVESEANEKPEEEIKDETLETLEEIEL